MRLGVDLGGTKIEIIALDDGGAERFRHRIATPRGSYRGIIEAIVGLVHAAETALAAQGHVGPHSLGMGIPGAISLKTGLAINSNSTEMNGQPLKSDLESLLAREVRFANDANCLAVSEAVDGAGAGAHLVFAGIIGTGAGAGIAIDGKTWDGPQRIAGEWGHNPLPWMDAEEFALQNRCWCGRLHCIETYVSGTGFQDDFRRATGRSVAGREIIVEMKAGEAEAEAAFARYVSRLGRTIAHVVNLLDPDVIVLGGGMSRAEALYAHLPEVVAQWAFTDHFTTPIRPALHGDSSGVRGAAWLWEADSQRLSAVAFLQGRS